MTDRCEPPPEHRNYRWHWLQNEDLLEVAEYAYTIGWTIDSQGLSEEQAYEEGWRYVAPCIPPDV